MNARTILSTIATIVLAADLVHAGGRTVSIDLRKPAASPGKAARRVALTSDKGLSPLRATTLDAGATEVGDVAVGDKLEFLLFDDVSISLTLAEKTPTPLGDDAFLAEASGYDGVKNAVVLRTADGLTADVQDYLNGKVYRVVSTMRGVTVEEIEPCGESLCGSDALAPHPVPVLEDVPMPAASRATPAAPRLTAGADNWVDILVAYDRNAAAWAAANGGGLTNFAQVAVQKMNAALANTDLSSSFRFRLVGVTKVAVSATDVHDALDAISDGDAGWKDIKTVREEVGADIVTTLIDTGSAYGTTGVGWSLSSTSSFSWFADSAYNVCAVRSVAQSHTMTHECGHNLGAGHSTVQDTQPGPQLYDYSAGYYFTGTNGKNYCTIMAYTGEGPGGAQVPYFSSPNHSYAGTAVGDSTHDNTRTIANTWEHAAAWRAQKVPVFSEVNFSPETGTLFKGSLSVTLTPEKAGAVIRYTLDGSDPTPSSPLYTGPIPLTKSTTVKAATFIDGASSFPFTAQYYATDDIGYALGLPELEWTAKGDWRVQTTNTVDGIGLEAFSIDTYISTLSTRITGPAAIDFRYRSSNGFMNISLLCDGVSIWKERPLWTSWQEAAVDIPAGEHEVAFDVRRSYSNTIFYTGVLAIDDLRLYLTQAPSMEPATTTSSGTAASFTGETMVSLIPKSAGDAIYYTLDGSDPRGEGAILYDGPFFITESTYVKAFATSPGRGESAVVEGLYIEQHTPKAGEWTLDGDSAYAAVRTDGRMIAELCWNYPGCGWSAALEPVMTDPAFTTWAALNGIYLRADSWGGKEGARGGHFYSLYRQTPLYTELSGYTYYPTFVFASAADTGTALGAMLARDDGEHKTNGHFYDETVESLIACFASFLTPSQPLDAPVPSVNGDSGVTFPFNVTLSNPNGTGTIYYTLDGTAPTRTGGKRYAGEAIPIPCSGTTLSAVVWPDDVAEVSGVPLSITYETLADAVGVAGVVWTNDPDCPWTVERDSKGAIRLAGGKDPGLESGSVISKLTATVVGPGRFSFSSTIITRGGGFLSFRTRGSAADEYYYAFNYPTNILVAADETVVLEWEYNYWKGDSDDYYGAFLSNIAWTPHAPPAAVSGLTASLGTYPDGTLLRWTPADNASAYAIYRGVTDNPAAATPIGTTDKDRYWDFTGEMGKTYYYWVAASNTWGDGPLSEAVAGRRPAGYTISFNANGGSGDMQDQGFAKGATGRLTANEFLRPGWSFAGWAETADGAVAYADGASITPAGDMTLYARWTANTYAVTLDQHGGSGGTASVTATYGSAMPSIAAPAKEGYVFGGYWTAPNGTGTKYYTFSGSSAHDWDVPSATTLHAFWSLPATVTVGPKDGPEAIQASVEAVNDGDIILVSPGTYSTIDVTGRKIEIRAAIDPADPDAAPVIDGGGVARCATLGEDAILSGFILRNGVADFGGGALGGTLEDCVIENCSAVMDDEGNGGFGGGAYGSALSRCTVTNCAAAVGGGLYECAAENSVVAYCAADGLGGGAYHATLTGCTVYGNMAETGGGVAGCTVQNSIVWNNYLYATDKKGVNKLGNCANVTEGKKTLYKNTCTYTDSSPKPAGAGNLAKDPLFVDAANGDFRLQWSSPVKNKGKATLAAGELDLGGLPRLVGAPDMGAYEIADGTPVPADYDGDGVTDAAYFDAATATWIVMQSRDGLRVAAFGEAKATPVPADYDGDGRADFATYLATAKVPVFRILTQLGEESEIALGEKGATPFAVDIDGDGLADPGVFQGNAKKPAFTVLQSTRGWSVDAADAFTLVYGTKSAKPVVGDFDGDGRPDFGCYTSTASKPAFSVALSTLGWNATSPLTKTLGAKGSEPCCGDFDGDGVTDFAAYSGTAKTPLLYRIFSTSKWREVRTLPFGEKGSRAMTADWDGDGAADAAIEFHGQWWCVTEGWEVWEVPAP